MKKLLLLIPVLFLSLNVYGFAQQYWERIYNNSKDNDEYFTSIFQINNNTIYTFGNYWNVSLIQYSSYMYKLDLYGNIIQEKKFPQVSQSFLASLIIDNKIFVVGRNDSLSLTILDTNGDIINYKNYFPGISNMKKIFKTSNNEIIIIGDYQNRFGLIVKLDTNGNLIWYKFIDSSYKVFVRDFLEINSQLFFLYSNQSSPVDTLNTKIMVVDSFGNIIKDTLFLRKNMEFTNFFKINSIYFILGTGSNVTAVNSIYYLDSSLNVIRSKVIENSSNKNDIIINANRCTNGFVINSSLQSTIVNDTTYAQIKIIDLEGNILKKRNIDGIGVNYLNSSFNYNNNFLFCGSSGYGNSEDGFIIRTDSNFYYQNFVHVKNHSIVISNFTLNQNYPNPFNPSTKISYSLKKSSAIELKLFDINGRLIKNIESGFKLAGSYEINFSAEELSSGVYFFSLYSEGILMDTKKGVIIK